MPARKDFLDVLRRAQPPLPRVGRIEVRVTEAEEELFKTAAGVRGLTVSEWLRACGRDGARRDLLKGHGSKIQKRG
jgi:uncharacterized protein (DUF1778 family)